MSQGEGWVYGNVTKCDRVGEKRVGGSKTAIFSV